MNEASINKLIENLFDNNLSEVEIDKVKDAVELGFQIGLKAATPRSRLKSDILQITEENMYEEF